MSTISSTLTRSQSLESRESEPQLGYLSTAANGRTPVMEKSKSLYHADQQAKFLHLQAEVDSLLEQLQTLKQQRLASADQGSTNSSISSFNGS